MSGPCACSARCTPPPLPPPSSTPTCAPRSQCTRRPGPARGSGTCSGRTGRSSSRGGGVGHHHCHLHRRCAKGMGLRRVRWAEAAVAQLPTGTARHSCPQAQRWCSRPFPPRARTHGHVHAHAGASYPDAPSPRTHALVPGLERPQPRRVLAQAQAAAAHGGQHSMCEGRPDTSSSMERSWHGQQHTPWPSGPHTCCATLRELQGRRSTAQRARASSSSPLAHPPTHVGGWVGEGARGGGSPTPPPPHTHLSVNSMRAVRYSRADARKEGSRRWRASVSCVTCAAELTLVVHV